MSTSLLTRAAHSGLAAVHRLRDIWFTLAQTSVASGLAWYLAHDVLAHPQPFFAPIASAVCLSISNVLRGQRAVQMMIGVTLGIGMGTVVWGLLGTGAVANRHRRADRALGCGGDRARFHRAGNDVRQPDRRVVDPGAGVAA